MTRVADEIARALAEAGVRHSFQVTGGDQSLWIALRRAGVRMILARSEQGATYMADGFARATGRPAVTYGQHGPGAANVAASLADAYWAASPVVALTSGVATGARNRFAYQEIDQQRLFYPVTRWTTAVARPELAAHAVRAALRMAMGVPSGPTHVDLPRDVIEHVLGPDSQAPGARADGTILDRPAPTAAAVSAILDILREARRPLLLAGSGALRAGAASAIGRLAARLEIPVATTPGGKGVIDEEDWLAIGQIGRYAGIVPNEIAREADVVLVLGSRLGTLSTRDGAIPSPDARIIHVDLDPSIFGRTYRPELAIVADATATAEAILAEAHRLESAGWADWTRMAAERSATWRAVCRRPRTNPGAALHPVDVINALNDGLPREAVVVADTGYMAAWTGVVYRVRQPGSSFFRAAGSLGWGIPGAIGIALGMPGRPVVCVTGDGGAGYNLLELETAVRAGIPLVVVVLDNQSLAFEYHEQRYNWDETVIEEANDFGPVDFGAIARAVGATGVRVDGLANLRGALAEAIAAGRPALLHVPIDKDAVAPVANYDRVLARDI